MDEDLVEGSVVEEDIMEEKVAEERVVKLKGKGGAGGKYLIKRNNPRSYHLPSHSLFILTKWNTLSGPHFQAIC